MNRRPTHVRWTSLTVLLLVVCLTTGSLSGTYRLLEIHQQEDGGWHEFGAEGSGASGVTALVLLGLAVNPPSDPSMVERALSWMETNRLANGLWPEGGPGSDASIVYSSMALLALARLEQTEAPLTETVDALVRVQNGDGGWGPSPGQRSTVVATAWATYALSSHASDENKSIESALSFFHLHREHTRGQGFTTASDAIPLAAIASASGAGFNATDLLDHYIAVATQHQDPDGSFEGEVETTALLALGGSLAPAFPRSQLASAIQWLLEAQQEDGGWAAGESGSSRIASTGLVLYTLGMAKELQGQDPSLTQLPPLPTTDGGEDPSSAPFVGLPFVGALVILLVGRHHRRERRMGR